MSSLTGLNDLDELILFMQERVREYDSDIDTSEGSSFFTTVLQPVLDRLGPDPYDTPLREFLLSRMKAEFPNMVLQDGEPFDDLVIKPAQFLLEPFRRQIRQVSNNQSLANPQTLNENEADNLGANFFVRRRLGGFSVGIARLYYSAPQAALITPNNVCFDGSGQRFIPVENQSISLDNMLFNVENNLYFFDIIVRSEAEGESYNIEPNTLVGIEGVSGVVKVSNKSRFEEGSTKEDTVTYVERVERSLTEKSLVTFRGIDARLLDVFENIRLIQVIGYGDIEMMRDIIVGEVDTPAAYAFFMGDTGAGGPTISLNAPTNAILTIGGVLRDTFIEAGVSVGDKVRYVYIDPATPANTVISEHTITAVDTDELSVSPNIVGGVVGGTFHLYEEAPGITLSYIPGGILQPNTPEGELRIPNNTLHIGGMLDVFVRAGQPEEADITLEGILDGSPLHFGTDLETFGDEDEGTFVQLTDVLTNRCMRTGKDKFGNALSDPLHSEILILQWDDFTDPADPTVPWRPTEDDIGRYIQILGPGPQGLLEITDVLGTELTTDHGGTPRQVVRIEVSLNNEETGSSYTMGSSLNFDTDVRIVEKVTVRNRVRDRDGSRVIDAETPTIQSGINFWDKGGRIGDSIVIETGDDAGIYSIRRILDWLDEQDTLILDRELTKTVTPLGDGNGSGVRYRLADELNVDLVEPKVVKIPLGTIFNGNDLNVIAGSDIVNSGGTTNYALAGAVVGDTLEILEGDNAGRYSVEEVNGTYLKLDAPALTTGFALTYSIYRAFSGINRPMVRVKEVELLDSNSQPTGILIPYGSNIDARALGIFSNRAEGQTVESFTGETKTGGGGIYYLEDDRVNFVNEGVVPGFRLDLLNVSVGSYTIIAVGAGDGLPNDSTIQVALESDGGMEFDVEAVDVHYTIGRPSAGFCRLYFLEPTSFELQTGLSGGRLRWDPEGAGYEFRFSEVDGKVIVPASGSDETRPRDLRVVQTWETATPGEFRSVLEITDDTRPGVFELEIQEGDLLEINEELPFRCSIPYDVTRYCTWDGTTTVVQAVNDKVRPGWWVKLNSDGQWFEVATITGGGFTILNPDNLTIPNTLGLPRSTSFSATFRQIGVDGQPAGLRTIAGSSQVTIPENSLIDFEVMDWVFPLAGQLLFINSGPDEGEYVIDSVINSKTLRLNSVMSSTTETIRGRDITSRDGELLVSATPGAVDLEDTTDAGGIGAVEGHYITLFESTRGDIDGSFEIKTYVSSGRVTLDTSPDEPASVYGDLDAYGVGMFSWVRTATDQNVEQPFSIYRATVTEVAVVEVATKRPDPVSGTHRGDIVDVAGPPYVRLQSSGLSPLDFVAAGVVAGDSVEVLTGGSRGVYPIATVTAGYVEIVAHVTDTFPVTASGIAFRIWSGLHGSRRMLTVGPKDSSNGDLYAGTGMPYRILRPKVFRMSSTRMANFFDGLFYYADVQVESQGAGDHLNLDRNALLVVQSGLSADGYTYTVDNDVLSFSPYEEVSLNFDRRFLPVGNSDSPENLSEVSGRNLRVTYERSTTTKLVNDLLRSQTDRPINANPIARHFLPSYVYTELPYRDGPSEATVGPEIEDYINTLGAEDILEVSDLEAFLTRRGATSVDHPILLATVTHDISRALTVNRTENRLGGTLSVPFNGTGRTSAFFAILGEGLTVSKQS